MYKLRTKPNAYGFGRDWYLTIEDREFWLGQDAKVCSRVLGCSPKDVINEWENETNKEYTGWNDDFSNWLADVLAGAYLNNEDVNVNDLREWDLCVQ
jgi:hypothetical protein